MITKLRTLARDRAGVTALEFALVAPLVFAVLFVAIEVAVIMLADAHLDIAANQVARQGRLGFPAGFDCRQAISDVMNRTLSGWIAEDSLIINAKLYTPGQSYSFADPTNDQNYKPECNTGQRGDMVVYRLGFTRPGLTGFVSWLSRERLRFERVVLIQNEP